MSRTGTGPLCPICGGRKSGGTTTYSVDLGFGIVVVRNVRATVCVQCGEEWISAEVASQLERLVDEARRSRRQVEVISLDG